MTICYFGIYNPNHTRNRLNIKGLQLNNVTVLECNTREKSRSKYWQLIKLYWPLRKQTDVIIVGFPGQTVMPLAWVLAKLTGKKIIFDAFISLYDSFVFDEKKYQPGSWQAKKYWLVDWLSCKLANIILLEVWEYANYFQQQFHITKEKFAVVYVGCDDEIIHPLPIERTDKRFRVHFHGTYIPAQGIPTIIRGAEILAKENIVFHLIGRQSTYGEAQELIKQSQLTNIELVDFMPYKELAIYMAKSDVCLGMFGSTEKAARAGAFKIIEAMAMQKPLITADTPAIREFLKDGENALLCQIANPQDLADKILQLKNNSELANKIAVNGYQTYLQYMRPSSLGKQLLGLAEKLIK